MPKISLCLHAGLFATICVFQLAIAQEKVLPSASKPLSPADALAKFQLAENRLTIELAAAEPDVIDPVAIRFDERGRMWVAEMRDYPLGPPAGGEPLSRIKVLEDRDFDGRFETASIFAEKLSFVTGLQPWRGGVIVTLAGRVAWMKDSDGDGKCDVDETWYTGFAEQNSQLRANHPRLALDNHVYVSNGLRGGVVVNKRLPNEPPINLQGRDFRFDPISGKAEAISGNGQFGMCFDDWGNRFTCTNRNPVIHVVLEDRYLKMAPKIPVPSVVQDVAASGEKSKVFPISRAWTTSNLHAGTFTAACGVHVYRGDTLRWILGGEPVPFELNLASVFTCDPTGNFVHHEVMKSEGASFVSMPAYEGKEFLASTDEWFRPVSVETGPDGCLYIVDMYRCVIEHPDFVPDELKRRPDLRLGDDRGRIWRIAFNGYNQPSITEKMSARQKEEERKRFQEQWRARWNVRLDGAEPLAVVAQLGHANAWQRETAQRLLLEGAYRNLARLTADLPDGSSSLADKPHFLVHFLWARQARMGLDADDLQTLYQDVHPGVCRQTLLVAEDLLANKKLAAKDLMLGYSPMKHPQFSFQRLLFGLSQSEAPLADHVSETMLYPAPNMKSDHWVETAFLLRHQAHLLEVFRESHKSPGDHVSLNRQLARMIGRTSTDKEALAVLSIAGRGSHGNLVLIVDELAQGMQSRGRKLEDLLQPLRMEGEDPLRFNLQDCQRILLDATELPDRRAAAARVLGHLPSSTDLLNQLLRNENQADIQPILVASLAQRGNESKDNWSSLLSDYQTHSLSIKRALIDNSFRRSDGPQLLLEQVKAGVIQPAEIDPLRRKQLLESKDAEIKKHAAELFAALNPANRQQALDDYQPVLTMKADAKRGALVFEKNCSTCHRVGEIGVNVAPDISDTRTKTAAQLLADIIQPNRAIDSNFIGYQLLLKDGTALSGLLSAETSTSLTLKQPGGKVLTVARDDVEQLKATGVSLMPDGLEKNIPPAAMADLLSYLKNWRYLDGKTPLSP